MNGFEHLTSVDDWKDQLELSGDHPVLLFKHSTT